MNNSPHSIYCLKALTLFKVIFIYIYKVPIQIKQEKDTLEKLRVLNLSECTLVLAKILSNK